MTEPLPKVRPSVSARVVTWVFVSLSIILIVWISFRLGQESGMIRKNAVPVLTSTLGTYPTPKQGFFPVSPFPSWNFNTAKQAKAWTVSVGDASPLPATIQRSGEVNVPAPDGGNADNGMLAVPLHLPDTTTISSRRNMSLTTKRYISYRVWIPVDARGWIGCLFYVSDKDGLWFEARSRDRLLKGRWNTVFADLSDTSVDMRPLGHHAQWSDYHAQNITRVGFKIYGNTPFTGTAYIDDIRGWETAEYFDRNTFMANALRETNPGYSKADLASAADNLKQWCDACLDSPLTISRFVPPPAVCDRMQRVEVSFEVDRNPGNPFDPDDVLVLGALDSSVGSDTARASDVFPPVRVFGFYNQMFEHRRNGAKGEYHPIGRPMYTVRFRPAIAGNATVRVIVLDAARFKTFVRQILQETVASFVRSPKTDRPLSGEDAKQLKNAADDWIAKLTAGHAEGMWDLLAEKFGTASPDAPNAGTMLRDAISEKASGSTPDSVRSDIVSAVIESVRAADNLYVATPVFRMSVRPRKDRGYLRISKRDPRYFEFDDGQFFFPVGHNLRSPNDRRCAMVLNMRVPRDQGAYAYENYFAAMRDAGENFVEIWMSSWFLGLEWTKRWPGYHGVGRYNLENAYKLDMILNMCRKYGLMVHLVIDNHGKLSSWSDPEWNFSPYAEAFTRIDGRPISVREFFRREDTRALYKKKLDYIYARYADDPVIAGIELVSEFDLTGDDKSRRWFRTKIPRDWVKEMLTYIRQRDAYGHPITIHYASDASWVDWEVVKRNFVDYVVGDQYWGGKQRKIPGKSSFLHAVVFEWRNKRILKYTPNKPYLITEFGGNWDGASRSVLEADLHCGIWSSWFVDLAGTPLFWWYDMIHENNLYYHFTAFRKYIDGEDKRGRKMKPIRWIVQLPGKDRMNKKESDAKTGMRCIANVDGGLAWFWAYDYRAMEAYPPDATTRKPKSGRELEIGDLPAGKYLVEWWDCYKGGKIGAPDVITVPKDHARVRVAMPAFTFDIAGKIRPVEDF